MQVGDVVKLLIVDGHPIGLVTDAWDSNTGGRQGYVKINGRAKQWIFRDTQIEVISAGR
tara:strand:+ start:196 stop:372 length:177 start_codon:yes stop_codon:yes gene_type:complete